MVKSTSSKGIGIVFAIFGVLLFSSKAVMVKLAYGYGVDSVTLLLLRMVFALPFYVLIAFWKKPEYVRKPGIKEFGWIFFFGFLGYYLASLFDFMGLQYLKAGLERIILFIYPTLVVLLSWLIFKNKITRIQFMAITVTYLGVLVTFWDEIGVGGNSIIWGGSLIFLSAITYAAYLVGSGWLIPKFGVLHFTCYAMMASTICVVVHYAFVGNFELFNFPKEVYLLGLAMAIFATLIPSFLVSAAIARLGAPTFSIFGSLGPISTIILAYFFLGEQITQIQLLGILVVIFGVFLVSRK